MKRRQQLKQQGNELRGSRPEPMTRSSHKVKLSYREEIRPVWAFRQLRAKSGSGMNNWLVGEGLDWGGTRNQRRNSPAAASGARATNSRSCEELRGVARSCEELPGAPRIHEYTGPDESILDYFTILSSAVR
jgi:hypothetical protein